MFFSTRTVREISLRVDVDFLLKVSYSLLNYDPGASEMRYRNGFTIFILGREVENFILY
jgi:hypothetical protein